MRRHAGSCFELRPVKPAIRSLYETAAEDSSPAPSRLGAVRNSGALALEGRTWKGKGR